MRCCDLQEETFWKNYFYRVGVIQQSFELSSLPTSTPVNKEAVASGAKQDAKKDALAGAGEDDLEVCVYYHIFGLKSRRSSV